MTDGSGHRAPRRVPRSTGTRLAAVAAAGALALTLGTAATAGAAPAAPHSTLGNLMKSPLSGGPLISRAIRDGLVTPAHSTRAATPGLKAHRLPNVQASEGGQPVNEDPIVSNPNNTSQLETGGNDYNCNSLQGFYNSSNGGSTWSHYCLPLATGASFGDGDPIVGYDLNGNAYIGGIDALGSGGEIVLAKSSNNGGSWGSTSVAVPAYYSGGLTDKPWMQIDTTATSPYANCIYISVTQFNSSGSDETITVSHSCNGGSTWSAPIAVSPQAALPTVNQFSDLTIGSNGTVYATWQTCSASGPTGDCGGTQATDYMSKSTDGGNTWSTPVVVVKPNLAPDTCGDYYGTLPNTCERVSNIPVIGVDASSGAHAGNLYVATYNWTGTFMQEQVSMSTNGGATWSAPKALAPKENHDQFFQWLSVSPKGTVGVTWLDRQRDPNNVSYNAVGAVSLNGGTSYLGPAIVSTAMSNPNNDGFGGSFMGDYTGNTWAGSNTLYMSWMDTRTNVSQDETGGYAAG